MKENLKEEFIRLLYLTERKGIKRLIDWLEETDFFIAPASTKYHLSKEGGLLEHSLNVYDELVNEYTETYFESNVVSLIIVALLHDICKTNYYSIGTKKVKKDNEWVDETFYKVDDQLPIGHGEKSVMILQNFIELTEDELVAIRWHMGGFEPKENYGSLSQAFNKYPLALYLHIADLKATYIKESE